MKILTFDVEEWFHLLDHASTKTFNEWKYYEVRIHQNMERILEILEKRNQKATFFCLGWIAETYPEIVKQIVASGHEIGSHGRMHQLVYEQSPTEFAKDIEYSIKTLEDITGQKVRYFRAPGFSIRENNKWAFEIIAQQGIEVDCSIFPAQHLHGGFLSYKEPGPSLLKGSGFELKEFPVSFCTILNKPIIFSGGGYFRLFPYPLIRRWTNQSDYTMSYFHPRDFDSFQPRIEGLSAYRKFRSYVGLKKSRAKLEHWLNDFHFTNLSSAVDSIDWNNAPVIKI